MALARLVAAVIDKLILTNWGALCQVQRLTAGVN